mmetsp:Transcript_23242/g.64824  ORF Transcript_23242/g.64824 Transcript_23242/m.64824 type:complete len:280 (+) Transcript_23242:793-1632(+)
MASKHRDGRRTTVCIMHHLGFACTAQLVLHLLSGAGLHRLCGRNKLLPSVAIGHHGSVRFRYRARTATCPREHLRNRDQQDEADVLARIQGCHIIALWHHPIPRPGGAGHLRFRGIVVVRNDRHPCRATFAQSGISARWDEPVPIHQRDLLLVVHGNWNCRGHQSQQPLGRRQGTRRQICRHCLHFVHSRAHPHPWHDLDGSPPHLLPITLRTRRRWCRRRGCANNPIARRLHLRRRRAVRIQQHPQGMRQTVDQRACRLLLVLVRWPALGLLQRIRAQ